MIRGRAWTRLGLVLVGLGGCAESAVVEPEAVASVEVAPDNVTLEVGERRRLSASARDRHGRILPGRSVTWSSDDHASVTVDSLGIATGLRAGQVRISATAEGKRAHASVRVVPKPVARLEIAPRGVIELYPGGTIRLAARAFAADGSELFDRGAAWTSSDERVVGVDATGLASARGVGTATIAAAVEGARAQVTVEVRSGVDRVLVGPPDLLLAVGESATLAATATRAGETVLGRPVAWSSADTAIIRVDPAGVVTARAPGRAQVSATVDGVEGRTEVVVGSWLVRPLVSIDGSAPPVALYSATRTEPGGVSRTTVVEARSGRLRILPGGPDHGRYEHRLDVWIRTDGSPITAGELVYPGSYTRSGVDFVFRPASGPTAVGTRLPDGRFTITQALGEGIPAHTFLYEGQP